MTRSTHRFRLVATRRPVERLGRRAAAESVELWLEATLHGDPCQSVGEAVARAGLLLAGSDLTGWFDEPWVAGLSRWLSERIRPVAESAHRHLQAVAVATPDLRCEFDPYH